VSTKTLGGGEPIPFLNRGHDESSIVSGDPRGSGYGAPRITKLYSPSSFAFQ
jgi:hypothetical protein